MIRHIWFCNSATNVVAETYSQVHTIYFIQKVQTLHSSNLLIQSVVQQLLFGVATGVASKQGMSLVASKYLK
jgi:hypothetical protein